MASSCSPTFGSQLLAAVLLVFYATGQTESLSVVANQFDVSKRALAELETEYANTRSRAT